MENDQKWKDASPWHPVRDAKLLKHLGKLAEEVNELGSALARCIIQGVEEKHPVTGKTNRSWYLDEVADVYTGIRLLNKLIGVTDAEFDEMHDRMSRKAAHLHQWHAYAEEPAVAYQYEIACGMHQDERKGTPEGYCMWETRICPASDFAMGVPSGPHIRNVRALR